MLSHYKKFYILISVMGHLLIFILMGIYLSKKDELKLGINPYDKIVTYLYEMNTSEAQASRLLSEKVTEKVAVEKTVKKNPIKNENKIIENINKLSDTKSKVLLQKSQMTGNHQAIPELVKLLHTAIQKQQQYPLSALQMEREGKATIQFTLFPNGEIKHLKVIKNSGSADLDEAALAAVERAMPFKDVDKYLTDPQEYQITVVFELT